MQFFFWLILLMLLGVFVFTVQNSAAPLITMKFLIWRFETSLINIILAFLVSSLTRGASSFLNRVVKGEIVGQPACSIARQSVTPSAMNTISAPLIESSPYRHLFWIHSDTQGRSLFLIGSFLYLPRSHSTCGVLIVLRPMKQTTWPDFQ